MEPLRLRRETFAAITAHAEREFPDECCGFVLADSEVEELRPISNIQNRRHAQDPGAFVRNARTAFLMDPGQMAAVLREAELRKLNIKVIYHSHPDHDAYFSATDRVRACSFDPEEPDYPETTQLVLSVRAGRFDKAAAFAWDDASKQFVETPLVVQ
jgi:adenylyltransferase/sulfurtransferase